MHAGEIQLHEQWAVGHTAILHNVHNGSQCLETQGKRTLLHAATRVCSCRYNLVLSAGAGNNMQTRDEKTLSSEFVEPWLTPALFHKATR